VSCYTKIGSIVKQRVSGRQVHWEVIDEVSVIQDPSKGIHLLKIECRSPPRTGDVEFKICYCHRNAKAGACKIQGRGAPMIPEAQLKCLFDAARKKNWGV
jgi:hypothetical protein